MLPVSKNVIQNTHIVQRLVFKYILVFYDVQFKIRKGRCGEITTDWRLIKYKKICMCWSQKKQFDVAIEAGGCKAVKTLLPNIIFDLSEKKIYILCVPKRTRNQKVSTSFLRNLLMILHSYRQLIVMFMKLGMYVMVTPFIYTFQVGKFLQYFIMISSMTYLT